jgi:predicted RNA-binding Zn-ribbon protein involved in translation (DUF1610 family)
MSPSRLSYDDWLSAPYDDAEDTDQCPRCDEWAVTSSAFASSDGYGYEAECDACGWSQGDFQPHGDGVRT